MEVRYLNVDCILRSNGDLTELLSFFEKDIFLLWKELSSKTGSFVGFETNLVNSKSPEEDILEFFKLFDSLPSALKSELTNCEEKIFDVGFESGDLGDPLNINLSSEIINKISDIGFSIKIRVYPLEEKVRELS